MTALGKILHEIDLHAIEFESFGLCDDYVSVGWVKNIIKKHLSENKCSECSRRKFYQMGYEDGNKDNDGWIPVEERLPEEAGTYIINALTGERNIVTFAKWQNRYKRFDMTGARTYWKIIAWCPLPEPYRPERSEGE
jgi:hypothetical protein